MPELSAIFTQQVQQAWGNPVAVAEAGINETFRHDRNFDHDDQVRDATKIGVMAGQTASQGPEAFVEAFQKFLDEE